MITLMMLVGAQPEPFLKYALRSTKDVVSRAVIVDTSPETENPNLEVIRKELPSATILQYHKGEDGFSFADARNLALENIKTPWVLWQDADEVHYPQFREVTALVSDKRINGIRVYFYHLVRSPLLCQYEEQRVILFRNQYRFKGKVHESINVPGPIMDHPYHYVHYGYVRPPHQLFQNWKFYLEVDPTKTDGGFMRTNPHIIIDDRPVVCFDFPLEMHPPHMIDWVSNEIALAAMVGIEQGANIPDPHHRHWICSLPVSASGEEYATWLNELVSLSVKNTQARYMAYVPSGASFANGDWLGDMVRLRESSSDIGMVTSGEGENMAWILPLYIPQHIGAFQDGLDTPAEVLSMFQKKMENNYWRVARIEDHG